MKTAAVRKPQPTTGDRLLLNDKKFIAAFEKWRLKIYGRHNPYPIEAITAFGAGWSAHADLSE